MGHLLFLSHAFGLLLLMWESDLLNVVFLFFFSFGINIYNRFTVQYNLFAGTIVAAGGDEQLDRLAEYQRDEQLGCFGLTEKLAVRSQAIQLHTYTIILH